MSGHRKAALALHALAPEDQRLILDELPDADQRILRGYLGELSELGFETSAVNDALVERPVLKPRDLIAMAKADDIVRIVAGEPVSFIDTLLRAGSWPWESAFLAALPGQLRVRVETRRTAPGKLAPARDAYVLRSVAQALSVSVPIRDRAPEAGRLTRLSGWFRSWKR